MTRVLVVDDKEENAYYLSSLLAAHGCQVESACHGAEALVKARRAPPDIIISDLLMPVMDGYTLLRNWKADARLNHAPFIVYTATYTDPEDERLALSLGADAFILKPAEPEAFIERLRAVQGSKTSPRSQRPQAPTADDHGLLREYSEALIRKLEKKSVELEEANRSLQKDIAARQLAEEALREGEQKFRLLTEVMPQLVWMTRADGWNTFFNQKWAEYTGLRQSEGDGWLDAFHPEERLRAETEWRHAVESGDAYALDARLRRFDGSYHWWLIRALPLRDTGGAILNWFGTCTDIDELKEAEAKLRRTQEQLRQAQKLEAIGILAGGVAHDFNNILSVILGYSAIVLGQLEPGAAMRDDVDQMRLAGERATSLIRQLLAFSRQQVLNPVVLDLRQVLFGMEKMLRHLLGESIELALLASHSSAKIYADPSQLEQIVMNLAVNARDAMPNGGLLSIETLNVELDAAYALDHPDVAPGPYVLLAITDTGMGMDQATKERIFEPFFTTKDEKGTGLGLSTVFGIVKQSNGHVRVESELGRGTTFKVYLPRSDRVVVSLSLPVPSLDTLRGSETILLVEDDAQLRTMTSALLRRHGYLVLDAQNGGEALLICEQHSATIHLMLTDLTLPRMSGRELAERLRPMRPAMHVLYVSGSLEPSVVARSGPGSGLIFLEKPVRPDVLLRRLRAILSDGEPDSS